MRWYVFSGSSLRQAAVFNDITTVLCDGTSMALSYSAYYWSDTVTQVFTEYISFFTGGL